MNKKNLLLLVIFIFFSLSCDKGNSINGDDPPPCIVCPFDFALIDFEPTWSPDGKTIAYVHGDTLVGKTGIWLVDTNGTNKRILFSSVGAYSPSWSPDGLWIAFSNGGQIYKIKINGDSLIQLTLAGRNFFPDWSPDGQWIAYNRSICEGPSTCGIWMMTSSGKNHQFLAGYGNYPEWYPTGIHILYLTRAVTQQGQTIGDSLWKFNKNINAKSFLTFLGGQNNDNRHLRYHPDGTKIAFTSQPNGGKTQIWVMNSDGSNPYQLTSTQGYSCDWSPSGEWIVYTDSRSVSGRLWLIRYDGSSNHQLTF